MPSATPLSLRRQRDDPHDEDQGSPGAATPSTGSSNKRARLNINGDSTPSSGSYETASQALRSESLRAEPSNRKHQPGSILRVKLNDFVTYTAVEFFPGPCLNMVIGPNGTGKSTLVCAICLGLGWGAQHLGRAKEVSEYVKHGCQEATIEIELSGDRKYPEVVIRCRITREGNKSAFYLNGSPVSKKEILKVARHFSIQIDNLCQFLPQDKVVEFAAMNPVELLHSTQRAVAPQEMLAMHERLKEFRKSQKVIEAENDANRDTLSNLENRQRMQQADVDRMRERQEIQDRVDKLEKARPVWEYRAANNTFKAEKEKAKAAATELKDLKEEVEPALRAVNAKQGYQARIEQVVKERKLVVDKAIKDADVIDRKLKDLHERGEEFINEKNVESTGGRRSRAEVARLEGNIARLKRQMKDPPPELDVASHNEQMRKCSRAIDQHTEQCREIQRQQTENTRRGRERQEQVQRAEKDLQDLESQAGQQLRKLQQASPDSYKFWQWLQQNQDKFEKHVYGPPLLECSVKDPRWADHIETLFQPSHFLLFSAQTKSDFSKLSHYADVVLHLDNVNIRTVPFGLDEFPPPFSSHELPRFGLEGWALDYIDGPETVMAMLASEVRLHVTGIGSTDTTPQQYDMLQNSRIDNWVTNKSSYRIIRRREYGAGATSAQVRDIRRAMMWTSQPVDMSAKRDLQENIQGWTEEKEGLEQKNRELNAEIGGLRQLILEKKKEHADLTKEKSDKQKIIGEFKALPIKLTQQEEKLAAVNVSIAGIRERIQAIDEKHDAVIIQRGQVALDYAAAVSHLQEVHKELYIAAMMEIEAASDINTLMERNAAVKTMLQDKTNEVDALDRSRAAARSKAEKALQSVKALMVESKNDPTFEDFLRSISDTATPTEMEDEISAEKARLELTHEGNGAVIKEYEQRQKRVEALKTRLEEGKGAFDEQAEHIRAIREQWEPELDKLVEKISKSFEYNMAQINCAGEVGIFKDENEFDNWAIQIMVKFRESETLTQLDNHRQSGGERAVSTIFYLMSLQTLTRSPFRVVDEINQGMDPRNERLVHKRMVNIACGTSAEENGNEGGGSQYFLITPKLLHDLEYARGMRVLCIASGERMPPETSKIDFRKCVEIARGLKARRGRVGVVAAG